MLSLLGESQQKLLKLLLGTPEGLSVDNIALGLSISRTAVNQHIAALERANFIKINSLVETGGRPRRTYSLTSGGQELFPKQYPWFSGLILDAIKAERGSQGLKDFLRTVAKGLAKNVKENFKGTNLDEKISEVAEVMQSLSYEAVAVKEKGEATPAIEATNCVYHHLAQKHPEVCEFDMELLRELLNSNVTQEQCILRNNGKCRFTVQARLDRKESTNTYRGN